MCYLQNIALLARCKHEEVISERGEGCLLYTSNVERLIPSLRDIQAEYYALPDMEAKREMFMTVRQRYNEKNLDPIETTTKFLDVYKRQILDPCKPCPFQNA